MKNKDKAIKTTTLSAQVAVSKTESGMDYVQVLPDNPRVGIVKPFSGLGKAQLLSNGVFDFIRKVRVCIKPILKLLHSSLSYGRDGFDRYVFVLPSEQRDEFANLLAKDVAKLMKFLKDQKNVVR
jgi:hypothetical protein